MIFRGPDGGLEVVHVDLEVALGMSAGGADLGGSLTDDDMSAVAAFPDLHA